MEIPLERDDFKDDEHLEPSDDLLVKTNTFG